MQFLVILKFSDLFISYLGGSESALVAFCFSSVYPRDAYRVHSVVLAVERWLDVFHTPVLCLNGKTYR